MSKTEFDKKHRMGLAYQAAIEGRPKSTIRALIGKDPQEEEIEYIVDKASFYVTLRDVILGIPWNQLGNTLSIVITANKLNKRNKDR